MAIEIRIYTVQDGGPERDQINSSMDAIGFARQIATLNGGVLTRVSPSAPDRDYAAEDAETDRAMLVHSRESLKHPEDYAPANIIAEQQADVEQAKAATQRERGKPGEGRARRTKAEIAEDEAADAADLVKASDATDDDDDKAALGISTGGERVNPDEDQDAADETAEKAANTKPGAALTTEDLRAAVATYQKKHGMAAAVALVKEGGLIGCTIDAVPQERLAEVIEALGTSTVSVSSAAAADKTDKPSRPEYPATKEGLMKAMLDYALKFDGTNDVSKANNTTMPATMEDCPKIFVMRFGEAINSLGKVPADGYAQAITDVQDATEKNPFKRTVKNG
jgi:hypothetical protein